MHALLHNMTDFAAYQSLLLDTLSVQPPLPLPHVVDDELKEEESELHVTRLQLKRAYIGLMTCIRKPPPECAWLKHGSKTCTCCLCRGCSNACDFYHSKDDPAVWVCKASGKVHYCTSVACQYTDVHEGSEMSCRLTGTIWGVRMYTGGEREKGDGDGADASSCDQLSRTREGIIQPNVEHAVSSLFVKCETDVQQDKVVAMTEDEEEEENKNNQKKKKQKKKKTRKPGKDKHHKDNVAMYNAVNSVLSYLPSCFMERKSELVTLCINVWDRHIRQSRVYTQHPGKYLILYHCLVVFNQMRDGCYLHPPDKDPVILPDEMMRRKFPDIKNLIISSKGQPKGVLLRQFTKTKKIFKNALIEYA
jgi:hypothetical protein